MSVYYQSDRVTLYHGDALEVLPTLSDIDMVFTSPPYNLGVSSGGGMPSGTSKGKWSGGDLAHGYGTHNDALAPDAYREWQHAFLRAAWDTLNESGAIFYNHKPRIQNGILQTPFEYNPGLPVRQVVIWKRAGGLNFSPTFYLPTHEWILILAKKAFRLKSKAASGAKDVWEITQERGNPHPAPFPVELPRKAIETTTAKVILDPFAGSGSTLAAAVLEGRKAIGIELEERWCEYTANRLRTLEDECSKLAA